MSKDGYGAAFLSPTENSLGAVMAGPVASDVELLLEEEDRPARSPFTFPRRAALALGCVGLVTVGILARGGARGLRSKSGAFVMLEANTDDCYEASTYYSSPTRMAGSERTVELSVEACQQRCFAVSGCAHFTYWPDGGCLLTDGSSVASPAPAKYSETVAGPPYCGEKPDIVDTVTSGVQGAADTISSGVQGAVDTVSSGVQGAVDTVSSGVQGAVDTVSSGVQDTVDTVAAGIQDAAEKASIEVPTVLPLAVPGINGTMCAKYPACVAAGIEEGNCCPNDDHVALGCCMGFAPVIAAPKIAPGSECTSFPSCVVLNITGACCPTPDGTRLGCCDSI
ncbi:CATSPER1 [Symbiodinium natans]|uniref:CATSPER1 protein n=1 Tax=Symbiodinium natans TaxID=878477 RepID=A0A812UIV1_9DINO|nr:CATSPER1 [Symbiodinium natans]